MLEKDSFTLETYNYSLPKELIAQYPCDKRDESKLLVYKENKMMHHKFYEIINYLDENDILVLNNTKVIKAKFFIQTEEKKVVEILLINSISPDNLTWNIFAKPRKYLKSGLCTISSGNCQDSLHSTLNDIKVEIINSETISFQSHDDLQFVLEKIGQMPLPPYIKRDNRTTGLQAYKTTELQDNDRYQTVFAKEPGAVAAPTASLHFTQELLKKIQDKGIEILYLTLHVGPGTFLPIRTDDVRDHNLIPEKFSIEKNTWAKILEHKKNGKKIIACGTTVTRTLEYLAGRRDFIHEISTNEISTTEKISGENDLYISPGYKFQMVDSLITNFHLPKSSLLLLASALIGWNNLENIYKTAIEERYRFFSYGDAMFIR